MVAKQKAILIAAVVILFSAITATVFTTSHVFADYNVADSNTKCSDGSNPAQSLGPNGAPVFTCKGTQTTPQQTTPGTGVQGSDNANATAKTGTATCSITKIGWILCPIITEAGHISDEAFGMLARNFLETEPELIGTSSNGTSPTGTMFAWEQARNLANILFIIAFLIIIISQVTGYGVSNYGIKKMIPRLVVAAIAVNLSYYVCQIIVDLTNILGFALENMLVDAGNTITHQSPMPITSASTTAGFDNGTGSSNVLTTIAAIAVAGTLAYVLLPLLFASLGMILFTCIAIVFILLMRKALIVLLVVASPIAFVAYLLPNTEKFFSKWLHMFWQLLLVFPIVGLLLGGGQLASKIILVAGSQQTPASSSTNPADQQCITLSSTGQAAQGNCQTGAATLSLGLVAAGVAVAPLLATYAVLRAALSSAGAVGGKISGAVTSMGGKLGGWSQSKLDKNAIGRGIAARKSIKENYGDQKFAKKLAGSGFRGAYTRRAARGIAGNVGAAANWATDNMKDTHPFVAGTINATTGSMRIQDTRLAASEAAEKIQQQELQAAGYKARDLDNEKLQATIKGSSDVNDPTVAAAIRELIKRQDFEGIQKALDKFGNKQGLASRVLGSDLESTGLFTGGQLGDISRGAMKDTTYASMVSGNLANGILSPDKIATSGPGVLEEASRMAVSQAAKQALVNSAHAAINDPILKTKISRNAGALSNFSQGRDFKGNRW